MNFNSPIPRSGLRKVHESSPLRSPRDSDAVPRHWIKGNATTEQLQSIVNNMAEMERAINRLKKRGADEVALMDLFEYDKTKEWEKGQFVVVYPTHELVTDGLLDEETEVVVKAPAGIYQCRKANGPVPIPATSPVEYMYNAPKWPTETPDSLVATNTYWWLWSLYPSTTTKCVDGEEVDVFVNAQGVPVQPT